MMPSFEAKHNFDNFITCNSAIPLVSSQLRYNYYFAPRNFFKLKVLSRSLELTRLKMFGKRTFILFFLHLDCHAIQIS